MAPRPEADNDAKRDGQERLITVLVTGFGPFQERYPVNPSYEIARSIPQLLPQSTSDCEAVRVIPYGSPIRVCYEDARKNIPPMLESYQETVDLVLHIGMASGRQHYAVERYAHRDNYGTHRDIDGHVPTPDEAVKWYGDCPVMMTTSLDYDSTVQNWQSSILHTPAGSPAHGADCRKSEDAGHFLCDYTYFNSLAWYGRRNKNYEAGANSDRPVLFLHVPAESDETMLDKGRAVAVALIRAMVDSYVGAA
ncbi:hypothetical protein LTR36_003685 [Oleoguttula mirabilis]|uniref:Peptidase C15, pyroglutamyl peptidase I-like protein n=1 Tax=Oleoguttula mirabilis TaxID=1507867 RepID=A0AAV9JIN8_9PEZI|nr:hypothetical protein LTR36_003685 [Oleoguttula mirabilis]